VAKKPIKKVTKKKRPIKTDLSAIETPLNIPHRFGELKIPDDVHIKDTCYVDGPDINESRDLWYDWSD